MSKHMKKIRWTSKVMWSAVLSEVVIIAQLSGLNEMQINKWVVIGNSVLAILVLVGILSDPTKNKKTEK